MVTILTPHASSPNDRPAAPAATDTSSQQQPICMPPPPPLPGHKSTILAICPQLPPSMQRAEWCLDDYVIMEKLYTGYASVGE